MNEEKNNLNNMEDVNKVSNNQQLDDTQIINAATEQVVEPQVVEQVREIQTPALEKTEKNKSSKKINIWLLLLVFVVAFIIGYLLSSITDNNNDDNDIEIDAEIKKSAYWISGNSLEPFDLYFLQLENLKKNKVYSPLSIKYALEMLEDGAVGESKRQISSVIGDYKAKRYINSKNMSFANSIFIKDTYQNSIKKDYINSLINKFNAEVKVDTFITPNTVNSWVSDKTLGLIDNLFEDISSNNFLLINALAIDMEWEEKFILIPDSGVDARYSHENFYWNGDRDVISHDFKDMEEKVSGMEIIASINNYDIVNTLGEENIRQTVKNEFKKYLQENPYESLSDYISGEDVTGLTEDEIMNKYLDRYIEEINSNYKKTDKTTDFSLYVEDSVKVFAKNLKEYDGTTLQYVAIMPTNEELDSYINKVKATDINRLIQNLKEIKPENFKEGVVTKITGFVPKFKFEYELDLMKDLKELGIKNVFDEGKANLTNISSDDSLYINNAVHKANIELTQEGIKAAAVTESGGRGAGGMFDYLYDVPVEEIDLTFDKPYMFIIRDKNSNEVWFIGTVYNPLLYSSDTTKLPY